MTTTNKQTTTYWPNFIQNTSDCCWRRRCRRRRRVRRIHAYGCDDVNACNDCSNDRLMRWDFAYCAVLPTYIKMDGWWMEILWRPTYRLSWDAIAVYKLCRGYLLRRCKFKLYFCMLHEMRVLLPKTNQSFSPICCFSIENNRNPVGGRKRFKRIAPQHNLDEKGWVAFGKSSIQPH